MSTNYKIISVHENFAVAHDVSSNMKVLLSQAEFNAGQVITAFSAKESFSTPTYLTIQIGDLHHISLYPEYLQFSNHSCDPNFFIDSEALEFIALKDIHVGDELRFFYPSTEWEMDRPFQCQCQSDQCLGLISGAHNLSLSNQRKYRLSKFIVEKLARLTQL